MAGGLQEEFERDYPEALGAINGGIDRFFDSLPARYAKQAEAIYLRHAASSYTSVI